MKIIYVESGSICQKDIADSMRKLGHEIFSYTLPEKAKGMELEEESIANLKKMIDEQNPNQIFSVNFFPSVSEAASAKGIRYLSWVFDRMSRNIYASNVENEGNQICVFDRSLVETMSAIGVRTVFHTPLAINAQRLWKISLSQDEMKKYETAASFIGSIYDERNVFYEQLESALINQKEEYTLGYLEGLLEAQMQVCGFDILSQNVTDELFEKWKSAQSLNIEKDCKYIQEKALYIDEVLFNHLVSVERERLLNESSKYFKTVLYTNNKSLTIGKCLNKGPLDYYTQLPKAVKASKVNLNITHRSIRTGIPHHALGIMGAGGFLLTNYQEEFLQYFEPDVDFSYFTNKEEMLDKIQFFASHDEEREQITKNGLKKVLNEHSYEKRLAEMLSL